MLASTESTKTYNDFYGIIEVSLFVVIVNF